MSWRGEAEGQDLVGDASFCWDFPDFIHATVPNSGQLEVLVTDRNEYNSKSDGHILTNRRVYAGVGR